MLNKILGSLVFLVVAQLTWAASLQINPVHVFLDKTSPFSSFRVMNEGDQLAFVEIHATKRNTQLTPAVFQNTTELVVYPPILTVPPHDSAMVRVGLPHPVEVKTELTYQISLQEVPHKIHVNKKDFVQVLLRMLVPVYVTPPTVTKQLNWRVVSRAGDTLQLRATDTGNVHLVLTEFDISVPHSTHPVLTQKCVQRLFPLQSQDFVVKIPKNIQHTHFTIHTITGEGEFVSAIG